MFDWVPRIPILTLVCFLPLAGAVPILWMREPRRIRHWATAVAGADLLLALPLWFAYQRDGALFQFRESHAWIPAIGARYELGIDGISLLLVLMTALLTLLSCLCSWRAIREREKEYYLFMLLLATGMLGVFLATDLLLFYVFWEVMLVPMYFLIGIWGGARRLYSAIKFFLYTLAGSVLMLLGFLGLYFFNADGLLGWPGLGNPASFSILQLHEIAGRMPPDLQLWIFLALFAGFAIKVPMVPFHTWLPDAHVEAPTAGSVLLAGVLLKTGVYGFVRLALPVLPDATLRLAPWLAALAVVGILYGALLALAQRDMKKLVAYSSISHLGFVMLGLFALNPPGLAGGVLQAINHGLTTGALFLLVGVLYERRHTRQIADYGGLARSMPACATVFVIIALASLGLPGLNGFIGELTILIGAFHERWWWGVAGALGIVLAAAYLLWLVQRVFFGRAVGENVELPDLSRRELIYLAPIVVICFWIGLYPKPFFDILERPVDHIVRIIERADAGRAAAADASSTEAAGPSLRAGPRRRGSLWPRASARPVGRRTAGRDAGRFRSVTDHGRRKW